MVAEIICGLKGIGILVLVTWGLLFASMIIHLFLSWASGNNATSKDLFSLACRVADLEKKLEKRGKRT